MKQLLESSDTLRRQILTHVSSTGGHLAPSLGVVELTVALHKVFNTPTDCIVWDVGHQAYAHKLLTGREDKFHTIRKLGGLSGFPKREESKHDAFGVGHSSTSISAALGIAEAKRLAGDSGKAIAVIGDGAMTGGLAFEGLNNAGHVHNKRLIVVLNDNKMSIDKNVGALSRFMNKGLTHPTYNRIRRDIKALLKIISMDDLSVVDMTKKAAAAVKDFFLPGSLFEALGFRYIGPIDGHNLERLVEVFQSVSDDIDKSPEGSDPILIHVITKKGKGYKPAEKNPEAFHGVSSFDVETGERKKSPKPKPPTYTEVFGNTLCQLMERDSRLIGITAAMPSGTGMDKVKEKFPGRYYDVGIAEQHATVFAAGLATRGFKPVVALYSSFLQRAYDQIIHDVCLQNLPVIFAIDRAGVVGADGPTHHGVFDLSFLRSVPNLIIMSPADENELGQMLYSATRYDRPTVLRYPRGCGVGVELSNDYSKLEIGKSRVIVDIENADNLIIAIGNMVENAKGAAQKLNDAGIKTVVIDARFIKPLDKELILQCSANVKNVVTIEDNVLSGGFGSAILELFNEARIMKPVTCLGYRDVFVEHGEISELHEIHGLTEKDIIKSIEPTFYADQADEDKIVSITR